MNKRQLVLRLIVNILDSDEGINHDAIETVIELIEKFNLTHLGIREAIEATDGKYYINSDFAIELEDVLPTLKDE